METATPATPVRADWRDLLRDASDLALVGIAVTVCALPVVTLGSAVATASAAIRHRREEGRYPHFGDIARGFARGIPAGAVAVAVLAVAAGLVVFNLQVAESGILPGGETVTAVTAVLAAFAAGLALLTAAVHSGRWRDAVRDAVRLTAAAWWAAPGAAIAVAFAVVIGSLVPATMVLLPGFVLFAGHAIAERARLRLGRRTAESAER
ncbi:hypothetical protein AB0I28_30785 [Phytomonospora sp. NPDC050363]|uniref:hypothetical protein n=1 Tax=Phytomonospora sp. NPDC050363 TaxID=3155642 RepID=UPI0033C3F41E